MKPTVTVKQVADMTSALRTAVKALTEQDVYIGVPSTNAGQREHGMNNAELSYIHEFGAPAAGIPARPHLLPGIEDIKDDAAQLLKDAASDALQGNVGSVESSLNKIGLLGQNAVRARFQNNDWPPLADATLDTKPLQRNENGDVVRDAKDRAKHGKSRRECGALNPLLDTGQLMRSHTYVLRKKGAGLITGGSK